MTTSPAHPLPTLGIDLGTTCSTIGWVRDGVPTLLGLDSSVLLPSVVCFDDDDDDDNGVLVGHAALNQLVLQPGRTVRSSKRFMGTAHVWKVGDRDVTPADVAAEILTALVRAAEAQLGARPQRVVVTVPAWFTEAQRAATRAAASQAGLDLVRMINEPTAAALAHAHGQELRRRALVYDLGGGTFDVSLVEQDGVLVEVRASHGDTHLGGDDLDQALLERTLADIAAADPDLGRAVRASSAALERLRRAVEQAKIELSSATRCTLRVPYLIELDGQARHHSQEMTREALEELASPLVQRTLVSVRRVLADAAMRASDVDELLLVGGSSQIPLVWKTLRAELGLEGSAAIAPDRAVGLGAAIQAAIVDGSRVDGILVDVAPYSLSVAAAVGPVPGFHTHMVCRTITPRNAQLPARHMERFFTSHPRQTRIELPIFQGSSSSPARNHLLGIIGMDGLPPAPAGAGERPIAVEFRHDLDGMVHIHVTDELSGRSHMAQLLADGEQLIAQQQAFLEGCDGLILGDGEDEVELQRPPPAARPALGVSHTDTVELSETFDAVLAVSEQLGSEHGEDGVDLVELARRGRASLEAGDLTGAEERFEELGDGMFELGVYL